jgi:hypothetical protein
MKKRLFCTTILSVLLIFVMSITASANMVASQTLSSYSVNLSNPQGTTININISVIATDVSDYVGASSIIVQKKVGNSWNNVASLGSRYSNDDNSYFGTLTYNGEAGNQYRVTVTAIAKQGNVIDSKSCTSSPITV